MSVGDIPTRKLYDCDGVAKTYPIPFQYLANDNVTVKHIDSVGAITTLILDDIGANGFVITSGAVVTNTTYPDTDQIWLIRETPRTQASVRKNNRRTPASVDDGSYDKLTMIAQEMEDVTERTIYLADTTPTDVSVELPAPVARRVPIWDATGKFLEYTTYDPDTQQSGAAASAAAALVSENNAADSETAAGVSETNAGDSETAAGISEVNAAASAAGVNLPAIQAGDDNKILQVNDAEDGYELTDSITVDVTGALTGNADTATKVGVLNVKVVEIGTWDMTSATGQNSVSVAHGLDHTKIRKITAAIRIDTDLGSYDLMVAGRVGLTSSGDDPICYGQVASGSGNHGLWWDATDVVLNRGLGHPIFDTTNFDTMGGDGNRGWVTIWYID